MSNSRQMLELKLIKKKKLLRNCSRTHEIVISVCIQLFAQLPRVPETETEMV